MPVRKWKTIQELPEMVWKNVKPGSGNVCSFPSCFNENLYKHGPELFSESYAKKGLIFSSVKGLTT